MWKDYLISKDDIEPLRPLIPDYCVSELREGSLEGIVVMDSGVVEDSVVGVVIYRTSDDEIEVEWVGPAREYGLPEYGADMVDMLARRAESEGGFSGLYARFREDDTMAGYFPETDFVWSRESGRLYSFRLSDAQSLRNLRKKDMPGECVPLKNADNALKSSLLTEAEAHEVILPLPYPVKWEDYDQEISTIYRGENGRAEGAILVDIKNKALILRLAYGQNFRVSITLLEHALGMALDKYGPEQEVVCPVVTDESEALLKKIVFELSDQEIICAYMELVAGTGSTEELIRFAPAG